MEQVLQQFCLDGTPISCEPLGNGHINRTFRVVCDNRKAYTLQRINRVAFRHPEELIENIDAVSRFIDAQADWSGDASASAGPRTAENTAVDAQGEFWRAYDFISGGLSLDSAARLQTTFTRPRSPSASSSRRWPISPAASLYETIPHFHDTDRPAAASCAPSVEADACGRVRRMVGPELDIYLLAREQELGTLCRMLRSRRAAAAGDAQRHQAQQRPA